MSRFHMTNVIRNTILSCQYKTLSANKLVDRKVQVGGNRENGMQRKLILLQYSFFNLEQGALTIGYNLYFAQYLKN